MTGNNLHKDALLWIKIPIKFHELHPKVMCCQLYAVEIESQQKICFYVKCKTLDMSFTEMEILTINSLRITKKNRLLQFFKNPWQVLLMLLLLQKRPFDIFMFLEHWKWLFRILNFTLSSCWCGKGLDWIEQYSEYWNFLKSSSLNDLTQWLIIISHQEIFEPKIGWNSYNPMLSPSCQNCTQKIWVWGVKNFFSSLIRFISFAVFTLV